MMVNIVPTSFRMKWKYTLCLEGLLSETIKLWCVLMSPSCLRQRWNTFVTKSYSPTLLHVQCKNHTLRFTQNERCIDFLVCFSQNTINRHICHKYLFAPFNPTLSSWKLLSADASLQVVFTPWTHLISSKADTEATCAETADDCMPAVSVRSCVHAFVWFMCVLVCVSVWVWTCTFMRALACVRCGRCLRMHTYVCVCEQ